MDATLLLNAPFVQYIATHTTTGSPQITPGSTAQSTFPLFPAFYVLRSGRPQRLPAPPSGRDRFVTAPPSYFVFSTRPIAARPPILFLARLEKGKTFIRLPPKEGLSYHFIMSSFHGSTSTKQATFDDTAGLSALRKSFPSLPGPRSEPGSPFCIIASIIGRLIKGAILICAWRRAELSLPLSASGSRKCKISEDDTDRGSGAGAH